MNCLLQRVSRALFLCCLLPILAAASVATGAERGPAPPPIAPMICSTAQVEYRGTLLAAGRAVVQVAVADLWEKPQRRSSLADQAFLGEVVRPVAGQVAACGSGTGAGDYLQVITESGYRAWAEIASLRPLSSTEAPYRESGPLVRVAVRLGSVYMQPTVTAEKPFLVVPLDVPLRLVRSVDERWREILLPDGRHAFIQAGDVVPVDAVPAMETARAGRTPASQADCVIEHALKYLGTPYLWGGRSTLGVDCSGLVLSSMNACGLMPPRDAGPQHDWDRTTPVARDVKALQAGDLLFFGKRDPGVPATSSPTVPQAASRAVGSTASSTGLSERITHVGIYVGGGRFIHATTSKSPVVQESLITDPQWTAAWLGTRRPPYSRR